MFNFFVDESNFNGDSFIIEGSDYNHVKNVLRMRIGEKFLVSCNGVNNLCRLKCYTETSVVAEIVEKNYMDTSLPITIHLFQGLPKSDKMELIIQKAVELGVSEITPVEMSRCIVKLDSKKESSKITRWQTIAESAAKQSKCSSIAKVNPVISFNTAIKHAKDLDLLIVPYESQNGMQSTLDALSKIQENMKVGILIGPEGGFSPEEIAKAKDNGASIVSLGKRILRTETAAITAVSMLMLYAETKL